MVPLINVKKVHNLLDVLFFVLNIYISLLMKAEFVLIFIFTKLKVLSNGNKGGQNWYQLINYDVLSCR